MKLRIFTTLVYLTFCLGSFSQTKSDIVRFLKTRFQAEEEMGKFINVILVGTNLKYSYKMSLTSQYLSQKWVQEVDLDLGKLEDTVVSRDENGIYWVKLLFSGDHVIFYDIENGQREIVARMSNYERGFSEEEVHKVQKYFKKLAKMCGAKCWSCS